MTLNTFLKNDLHPLKGVFSVASHISYFYFSIVYNNWMLSRLCSLFYTFIKRYHDMKCNDDVILLWIKIKTSSIYKIYCATQYNISTCHVFPPWYFRILWYCGSYIDNMVKIFLNCMWRHGMIEPTVPQDLTVHFSYHIVIWSSY